MLRPSAPATSTTQQHVGRRLIDPDSCIAAPRPRYWRSHVSVWPHAAIPQQITRILVAEEHHGNATLVCRSLGIPKRTLYDKMAAPVSTALGVLGMPGMTAYIGLLEIGQPKPGETVVVAAASGAVGSVVGQVAKIKGCNAVGIAGGAEKCHFVTGELGFDACVDHRAPDFAKQLEAACPKGIDVYFETFRRRRTADGVAAAQRFCAHSRMRAHRAVQCDSSPMPGPDMFSVLRRNATLLRGFIVSDFSAKQADFLRDVGEWVRTGRLKYREDIINGLGKAPASFLGVLQGQVRQDAGGIRNVSMGCLY